MSAFINFVKCIIIMLCTMNNDVLSVYSQSHTLIIEILFTLTQKLVHTL